MSLSIRILDALRVGHMSADGLRHTLHCTHEDLYSELVRLEGAGRLVIRCNHFRGEPCIRTWGRA